MSFPSAFQIESDIHVGMLTFTLFIQLGMVIAIAQHKNFYVVRSPHIYHRYGDGGPHIYVELGTGSPILWGHHSCIYRGPHIYHRYGDGGPRIYVDLGTESPNLYSFGDPVS